MMFSKKRDYLIALIGFAAILAFYCFTYYPLQIFTYPSKMHSWAQADRLALALSFYDNGMNFFKPATFSQFSHNGIVGVEFPIQSYIAAALGHIFGRENISFLFRLENVIITCIGLMFLFASCYKRTGSFIFSMVTPLFIFASPVFIYYTGTYIPDPSAAAIVFIAFFFVFDFFESDKLKPFTLAVIFFALATLIKTSVGVYFMGFLGIVFLENLTKGSKMEIRRFLQLGAIALAGLVPVLVSYFYIEYLNERYDAWLFWHKPAPFVSLDDFYHYLEKFLKPVLLKEYFVLPQILLWSVAVTATIPLLYKDSIGRRCLALMLMYMIGALVMFVLLGHLLAIHEYYFTSIFIPFLAFCLLSAMLRLHETVRAKEGARTLNTALFVGTVILFFFADYQANQRLGNNYNGWGSSYNTDWLANGKELLNSVGIPKEEQIVVLNEPEPNLSLIYFDRRGYVIEPSRWGGYHFDLVKDLMREKRIKILVLKVRFAEEYLARDSTIFRNFDLLTTSDQIAVYSFNGTEAR